MDDLPEFKSQRNQSDDSPTRMDTGYSGADDGSHMDAFRVPDVEDEGTDPDAPFAVGEDGEPIDSTPVQIDRDAFWIVFQTAFNMPGMMVPKLEPLAIHPREEKPARAASDATYALLEIYFPSALMPQSETLAHLMVAAPFFIGKAMVVREIIRASKARPVNPPQDADQDKPKPEAQAKPNPNGFGDIFHPGQELAS